MTITLEEMRRRGHEQVMLLRIRKPGSAGSSPFTGPVLGPALGGTRMYPYSSEEEALRDVLELSRGMTYKAAAAGLNLGGGKAVIIADPRTDKSEALFRAFGRFVNRLNGLFYTGEDVGTDVGTSKRSQERQRMSVDSRASAAAEETRHPSLPMESSRA